MKFGGCVVPPFDAEYCISLRYIKKTQRIKHVKISISWVDTV